MLEVQRLYADQTGHRFNWSTLESFTGIRRQTLRDYLEKGVMPTLENMAKLAKSFDVEPNTLWARWLGVGSGGDQLTRIADALDRAYPPIDDQQASLEAAVERVVDERWLNRLIDEKLAKMSRRPRPGPRAQAG